MCFNKIFPFSRTFHNAFLFFPSNLEVGSRSDKSDAQDSFVDRKSLRLMFI